MNEKHRSGIVGKSIDQLLGRPRRGRVLDDVEMNNLSPSVLDEHQNVQNVEGDGKHSEKNAGNDLTGVILQKGAPGRRRYLGRPYHVLLDGRLADGVSELEKLTLNPRRAPQ